jgi:hypothetical protein
VLSCGIVLLTAQKPAAQTVEARAFVLKDADGKVRAELHMTGDGPELRLYDSQHNTFALMGAGPKTWPILALYTHEGSAGLGFVDERGPAVSLRMEKADAFLTADKDGPFLHLNGSEGSTWASVDKDGPSLSLEGSDGSTDVSVYKDGPRLYLKDSAGFNTSIGNQALVAPKTGEKTSSSAASIHLFDKDGHLLWSAP